MNDLIDVNAKKRNSAKVVVKNKLFNCKYSLTLWQEKLLKGILFLDQQMEHYDYADVIEVDKAELKKLMFGENPQSDSYLLQTFRNVMSKVVMLKSVDGDYILSHWVQRLELDTKVGKVKVVFDPDIVPILKEHGNFTLLDRNTVFGAKCVWTERLYPMLKQYKDFGKRTITVEEIKNNWELPKSYHNIGHLKDKVIDSAVAEINRLSDISVSYLIEKKPSSRAITGFRFTIKEKPVATVTVETTAKEGVKNSIIKAILEWADDVNLGMILNLQQEDESTEQFEGRLIDALDYCKNYKSAINGKGAFLYSAVLNTYRKNGVAPDMFTDIQEEVRQEKQQKIEICGNCQHPDNEYQIGNKNFFCDRKGKVYNNQIAKWVQCPFFRNEGAL